MLFSTVANAVNLNTMQLILFSVLALFIRYQRDIAQTAVYFQLLVRPIAPTTVCPRLPVRHIAQTTAVIYWLACVTMQLTVTLSVLPRRTAVVTLPQRSLVSGINRFVFLDFRKARLVTKRIGNY